MMNLHRIPAVILAGGRATRMGGNAKHMKVLAGKSLLEQVLSRISPQCGALALNLNAESQEIPAYGLSVLADDVAGQPGPLAGILVAMDWAATQGHSRVLTVPTDTPFLPRDLVSRLAEGSEEDQICLAASRKQGEEMCPHPTVGLWPTCLRNDLRASLRADRRKVMRFANEHNPSFVIWESEMSDPFFNVNSLEDLARAETLLLEGMEH